MAVISEETAGTHGGPAGAALPPLTGLPGVGSISEQAGEHAESEYYDTSGLRLAHAGVVLERRLSGTGQGWRLTLPAALGKRPEIRLPPGGGGEVPGELAGLVQGFARGEPLRPVARLAATRRRVSLLGRSGEPLATVCADEISAQTMGGATAISRWQEATVERSGGDRRLAAAAAGLLRDAGFEPADGPARLARALGVSPPGDTVPPRLGRSTPAGEVVLAYLRAQARELLALDPLVRRDEPDAVHRMRVATRRLRATMRSFAAVLPRAGTRRLAGELQWLGGVLGEARDSEVLARHLSASLHRTDVEQVIGPVEARVQAHFARAGASARAAVLAALASPRYFALLDGIDRLLADPPLAPEAAEPAGEVLPAALRRAYRRAARRMRRARRAPAGRPREAALHQARKAMKRARYAGESAAPALGTKARRFTRQVKQAQSVLGELQDTVVARQAERQLGISAHLSGENAFTYGLLFERDTQDGKRIAGRAWRAWERASQRRNRHWMR